MTLIALLASLVTMHDWCSYQDETVVDGRRIVRVYYIERFEGLPCPDPGVCVWADVDFDGLVGGPDQITVSQCFGEVVDR